MTAGHLLTDVEQQGVVTLFGNIDSGIIEIALTDLLTAALGGSDIHHLARALSTASCHCDTAVCGVEIDKSIVVPQYTIALTRQEHGQTNLGVHLCQTSAKTADIGIAVLKLSKAEEEFILR